MGTWLQLSWGTVAHGATRAQGQSTSPGITLGTLRLPCTLRVGASGSLSEDVAEPPGPGFTLQGLFSRILLSPGTSPPCAATLPTAYLAGRAFLPLLLLRAPSPLEPAGA